MKRMTLIFALLGLMLNAAAQQWVLDYGEVGEKTVLYNGFLDSKGINFMVGAKWNVVENEIICYYPFFMTTDADGNCESKVLEDEIHRNQVPFRCIQLKNGNYFVACRVLEEESGYYKHLAILVLNSDMDIIVERNYAIDSIADTFRIGQLLVDEDGSIVLCGSYAIYYSNWFPYRPAFYRFDEEGNILACRYAQPDEQGGEHRLWLFECHQLMKHPQSDGYLIIGKGASGATAMIFYDRQFNYVDDIEIEIEHGHPLLDEYAHSDLWLSDDEMLLLGSINGGLTQRYQMLGLLRLKTDGTIVQCDTLCQRIDTNIMVGNNHGMVCINDTTIFGAYYAYDYALYPVHSGICLFDRDMELLGNKFLIEDDFCDFCSMFMLPTSDNGCLLSLNNLGILPDKPTGKIVKMRREDFNPIPCGVHKVPKQEMQASAFPNPTKDEVHFDISALPRDGENRICITDNLGRVRMSRIIRGEGNLLTVGVSSLEPGVYAYVIYNSQNELLKGKFVKE